MKKILFVGEKRSRRARELNLTWKDGGLCAKHLFTAIKQANLEVQNCHFKNVFREILEEDVVNKTAVREIKRFDGVVVAMGRKVERVLKNSNINHEFIYHPATRGEVRNLEKYCQHFNENLKHILI